jgi:hypothetical protein
LTAGDESAILKVEGDTMTPEIERERRANFIIRNAEQYSSDRNYRMMVDNTVFLTQEQKEKSQLVLDDKYGWQRLILEVPDGA